MKRTSGTAAIAVVMKGSRMPAKLAHDELVSLLISHSQNTPTATAVTFVADPSNSSGHVSLTYESLDSAARRIGSWLHERFAHGDRALLLYSRAIEFVPAFFGCLYAGVIPVPSSKPGRYQNERDRLAWISADAEISVVLTDELSLPTVAEWSRAENLDDVIIHTTDNEHDDVFSWDRPAVTRDTPALLQYTSGTTGNPKGVLVTHANLITNMDSVASALGLNSSDRYGGWIPLYHDMGLIGLMLPGILRGAGYVQIDQTSFLRRPHLWWEIIDQFDVNCTASPEFGYELSALKVTDNQLESLDLSRVRAAVCGSEPVQASVLERFCGRFSTASFKPSALVPMYGLAEATLLVTGTSGRPPLITRIEALALEQGRLRRAAPGTPSRDLVGCGKTHGTEVTIVDPRSREVLPQGAVGEIWLRGPSVALGYWHKDHSHQEAVFDARTRDGAGPFLRTGDLGGWLDGDLFITGRLKDVLLIGQRTLYPQDVEHELMRRHQDFNALQSAIFTVDGEGAAGDVTPVVIIQEIRGRLPEERAWDISRALERTAAEEFELRIASVLLVRPGVVQRTTSGKVRRALMRERYVAKLLRPITTYAPMIHSVLED